MRGSRLWQRRTSLSNTPNSIYKTWRVHVPVTCLAFSAEGATLYVGTENGKVLGQDLRALDKPTKSITVSEQGDRVVALSMQVVNKMPAYMQQY